MNLPFSPPDFSGARILITGGLGFIGSNLARRLADLGAKVILMDPLLPELGGNPFNIAGFEERVQVQSIDLRDETAVAEVVQGQDVIFNLAAQVSHVQSMQNPLADLDINVRGQLLFLENCRRENPKTKIIFAGTRQVYGPPCYLPVDENHPANPVDINGVNKLAGEWYHRVYFRVYGLRSVVLRMTNVYGPRMRVKDSLKNFVGFWIRRLLDGEEITIYGDGSQVRDLLYIDDAVDALLLAAIHPESDGQVYNLGGNEPIHLLELAQLMVEIHGSGRYTTVLFPTDRKNIDIGDYLSDCSKIRSELGWQPIHPLREGLTATLDYYRRCKEYYW